MLQVFKKNHFFFRTELHYACNIPAKCLKVTLKTLGGCPINHYSICALVENWRSSKCCKFVKNHFLGIRLFHAYLQYVCNISAKYYMDTLKAPEGVDFIKYALLPIIQYVQWSKKCCKFVMNYFFSINHLHAHLKYICNIPAKY